MNITVDVSEGGLKTTAFFWRTTMVLTKTSDVQNMRSRFCWCTFNAWHEKKHAQLVDKKMPQSKTCGENMQHKKTPCNMRGNQCDLLSETSRTAECWKCWKRDDDVLPSNMLAHFWLSSTCWCQRHPQIFGRRMGKRWKQGRKGAHSAISQRWSQEIFFSPSAILQRYRNSYDPGIKIGTLTIRVSVLEGSSSSLYMSWKERMNSRDGLYRKRGEKLSWKIPSRKNGVNTLV